MTVLGCVCEVGGVGVTVVEDEQCGVGCALRLGAYLMLGAYLYAAETPTQTHTHTSRTVEALDILYKYFCL